MIIFPAVDIQNGKAVRLLRGAKDDATVYADDPLDLAKRWQAEGASWLHIIDLDGAFSGNARNMEAIARIAAETGLKTQVGGGIRSISIASAYFEAGATRLIIGTIALENPGLFREMCAEFPGRIGVSLDGSGGFLKTRGWLKDAGCRLADAAPRLEDAGAAFIIYTDIERDGAQTGVNANAIASLLEMTRLPVIAAGGVATLEDVKKLHSLRERGNLEGAISGRALCEGSLSLAEANSWLAAQA